jgi:uncharacterized RDD family membrane protein YckC
MPSPPTDPYGVPVLKTSPFAFAPPWKRFIAFLIDVVVVGAINTVILETAKAINPYVRPMNPLPPNAVLLIGSILALLITVFFEPVMEGSRYQATIGKLAMGLIVTDRKGRRISFFRAMTRHVTKAVSAAPCLVGFLMILFTENHQGLHDWFARTCVVPRPLDHSPVSLAGVSDPTERDVPRRASEGITAPRDQVQE